MRPLLLLLGALLPAFVAPAAVASEWPMEFDTSEGTITLYQPQPESLTGSVTEGRMAMSIVPPGKTEPVFGALWYDAQLDIDKDERRGTVVAAHIKKIKITGMSEEQMNRVADAIEAAINDMPLTADLETLIANLEVGKASLEGVAGLKNDPPKILVSNEPAVLVLIDGDPVLREIENTGVSQVINSPYTILYDQKTRRYFLTDGETWFEAADARGPYDTGGKPTSEVKKLADKAEAERARMEAEAARASGLPPPAETDGGGEYVVPKIYVATEPTELIVFDGPPQWAPFSSSELLYARNTDDNVLQDIDQGYYYLLVSGRWFRAKSLDGPWSFVRPDQLPERFKEIPPDSEKGAVRAQVAGTDEALEALVDNFIPQTAAVSRADAKLTVQYDGSPKFEKIPGTKVEYALNASTSVLRINGHYYACDNAIWFESGAANGPWSVADDVPDEVDDIPPSSPVYNTRYVQVYHSTPEVVYVGYLPGYVGSYPYYGTVVYGTGHYYRPWIGPVYYYPRPYTWGFNVSYNPWTGWGFGLSFSAGFFNFSVGWGSAYRPYHPPCWGGGWWGPGGYRPPYHAGGGYWRGGYWGGGYRPGGNIIIGGDVNINVGNRINVGNNIYQRPEVRPYARSKTRDVSRPGSGPGARPATRPNDVLVDRSGNLVRPAGGGKWETLDSKGDWKPTAKPGTRPSTRPATPTTPAVERPTTRPAPRPATPAAPATRPGTPTKPPATPTAPSTRPAPPRVDTPVPQPQPRPASPTLRGPSDVSGYDRGRTSPSSRPAAPPTARPAPGPTARPAPRPAARPAPRR